MKKTPAGQAQSDVAETQTESGGASEAPAHDTPPAADAADTPDEPAAPAFDPAIEWPAQGGCWVRQADGTLTKEG